MMNKLNLTSPQTHILIGDFKLATEIVLELISEVIGVSAVGHPDVWVEFWPTFAVADSRTVKSQQQIRPLSAPYKFFVLGLGSVSTEAQNALLKVLEEPSASSRIILVAGSDRMFLPTVLSRCQITKLGDVPTETLAEVKTFLQLAKADRLALVARWQAEKKLTKSFTHNFLDSLEQSSGSRELSLETKQALVATRRYLYDRALLPKIIFEYLALALPSKRNV